MESLVEKWKNTLNSRNFSSSLRENTSIKNKASLQSSNEKPPNPKSSKKNLSNFKSKIKTPSESSSSSDDLSLDLFKKSSHKNLVATNTFQESGRKQVGNFATKAPDFIKENVYLILGLFENEEVSLKERISEIKKILEKVYSEGHKNTESIDHEEIGKKSLKQSKAIFSAEIEGSTKLLSELEGKLFQIEKEKLQLKKEKEELNLKLKKSEEDQKHKKINFELVERLQESHKLLEKNNVALLDELESTKRRMAEQQIIYEHQINEINEIFEKIKAQSSKE